MSKAAERLAGIGKHGVYLVTGTFETGRMRRDRAMLIAAAELVEACVVVASGYCKMCGCVNKHAHG